MFSIYMLLIMEHELNGRFYAKFALMILFILGDLYLNSKAEYEALQSYSTGEDDIERITQIQIILFGCILLVQVSIFSIFFLILCDTYPFQMGLLGNLARQFKSLLILHPVYFAISSVVGCLRLVSGKYLFLSWSKVANALTEVI